VPEYRQAAFNNGADFFFSKDCKPEEILDALESLMGGKAFKPQQE
jgi:DNA-binding NarL/FixJ family response regulator